MEYSENTCSSGFCVCFLIISMYVLNAPLFYQSQLGKYVYEVTRKTETNQFKYILYQIASHLV